MLRGAIRWGHAALQVAWYALWLGGCASYHAAPLNLTSPLAPSLAALRHQTPGGAQVPATPPLTIQNVAALAVLNDPDLVAARTQHNLAAAQLLSAGLLPDPTFSGGFAALISGPADAPAISGALTEDISALITYKVDVRAAKAGLAQVDAGILWQEWQVASQAEQLCITLAADAQTMASLQASRAGLAAVNNVTMAQVNAGNLTIAASSASLAALAAIDTLLNTQAQTMAQDTNQLDALLGLAPGVAVPVALAPVPPLDPAAITQAVANLAARRPDLIALRYGYAQSDAKLRGAIMAQFLPITIGPAGGTDTTKVFSLGPQISLTLPLFNRNRGVIAAARATRAQLGAQFQASRAAAQGGVLALAQRIGLLQGQVAAADQAAESAAAIAGQAQTAFANGALDALSAVNLTTAAADRVREAIALRAQLLTARLSLATLAGIGLPPVATPDLEPTP